MVYKIRINKSIFLIFILFSLICFSQNTNLQLKSFSIAFGGFQPYSGGNGNANFYSSADLTSNFKKNLFSISLNRGFDIGIYNMGSRYNLSLDALYGREIKFLNWLSLELHAGIGFFRGSYYKNDYQKWKIIESEDDNLNHITPSSVSFPAKLKILIYYTKKSSFGFNISTNVNKVSNYVAYNIIFQRNL